jgi:opacity protein-like surface antigen
MKKRSFVAAFVSSLLAPAVALAGSFEVTPFIGYAEGTFHLDTGVVCVQGPCPTFLESEDDSVAGLIVDYRLAPRLDLEIVLGHQETRLSYRTSIDSSIKVDLPAVDLDVSHVEVGLRRRWQLGRAEPFAAIGVGMARLDSARFIGTRIDDDRSSFSLGGGARVALSDRLALRLEARTRRIDLPARFHETGGVAVRLVGSDLDQLQYAAGLSVSL